jgi:HD-like signal output (HDOD) protein
MLQFLKSRNKAPGEELRSLLGNFELPSFNEKVMNALRLLRDPESSIQEITAQVQMDPAMCVKVLRTVNSAAFGLASKVSNIQHAVSLLGRSRLEPIILSIAVKDALPKLESSFINDGRFWATASERACLAEALAQHLHPATKGESFIAALLQDMAIPIMMYAHKDRYIPVMEKWFTSKESRLDEIEKDALGHDHASIGALMAAEWDLPEYVICAVEGHHKENGGGEAEPAVKLVAYLRYGEEERADVLKEKCLTEYGIEEALLDQMIKNAFDHARDHRS